MASKAEAATSVWIIGVESEFDEVASFDRPMVSDDGWREAWGVVVSTLTGADAYRVALQYCASEAAVSCACVWVAVGAACTVPLCPTGGACTYPVVDGGAGRRTTHAERHATARS